MLQSEKSLWQYPDRPGSRPELALTGWLRVWGDRCLCSLSRGICGELLVFYC